MDAHQFTKLGISVPPNTSWSARGAVRLLPEDEIATGCPTLRLWT